MAATETLKLLDLPLQIAVLLLVARRNARILGGVNYGEAAVQQAGWQLAQTFLQFSGMADKATGLIISTFTFFQFHPVSSILGAIASKVKGMVGTALMKILELAKLPEMFIWHVFYRGGFMGFLYSEFEARVGQLNPYSYSDYQGVFANLPLP